MRSEPTHHGSADVTESARSTRVELVGGAALTVLGLGLLAAARADIAVVVVLCSLGLLGAGVLVGVRSVRSTDSRLRRAVDAASALALVVLATVPLLYRTASVRVLATLLALGLVVLAVDAIGRGTLRRQDAAVDTRLTHVVSGVTALVGAGFVVLWPRLSLSLLGLALGGWLVLRGVSTLVELWRGRPRRAGRRRSALVPALAGLLVTTLALGGTLWLGAGRPGSPPDAFYTPPLDVPAEPGSLVRAEPFTRGVPDGQRAWRILYTTTDGSGQPQIGSGTVLAPTASTDTSGGTRSPAPVLSIAHGTTGVATTCAPSLLPEPFADGAGAALVDAVDDGWVAVVADYVGLGTAGTHAYLVGPDAAHHVLDATRAAARLTEHDPSAPVLAARTVLWGHSQGGHTALWAGALAQEYAPELDLLGVAALAPAADLTALAREVHGSIAGSVVAAFLLTAWDELGLVDLAESVTVGNRGPVREIATRCFNGRDVLAAAAQASQLAAGAFDENFVEGRVGELLQENTPTLPVPVPLLVAQGLADDLVRPGPQQAWVAGRCAEGQAVDYREYPEEDHVSVVAADSALTPELLAWTADRLADRPAGSTC